MTSEIQKAGLMPALRSFGAALGTITDEDVPAAYEMVAKLEKMLEEARELLKSRALLYLNVNGVKVTQGGTAAANVGGHVLRAVPMRTGTDPKKLEKLLRTKKLDPAAHMDATLSFKVNPKKLEKLVEDGVLSEADMQAVAYDKAYRIEVKRNQESEYTNE